MEMTTNKCPNCGAVLHFEGNGDTCFCSHCGTQVFRDSNNKTITIRTIDDARIREAELKDRQQKRAIIFSLIAITIMIAILILMFMFTKIAWNELLKLSGLEIIFTEVFSSSGL
ncbi:hypothetical protein bpr_IV105 (plasmid) [Butyrivibrio proteoclasticus B316]|uniref:Uncharacterized protein n=1 Tax=Butyrivibrio proteoclasticus (strain ATCC 51982 / DSM 14932 / B316) TaxID=515622 RepID=E0S4Y8_BUTPB|nr:hypothetical protein [Butyrivibrio proteoclasticus]ADL36470.1 hypothetical protein bpr_IV105 [Butyrivibrio proteoclasticus B316]